ncbi:hypothetical protein EYZ11_002145 [Aspergillus tanneri]|uniref:FAD linked oxidase N-terminal domain-containing protein n=1 Tax=Aspergillus tanneri TaxID=1220188 RepID=A0A4V3UQE3_9EURO|nr:uncharacterized protein ATNIH1004_010838 [Aspergillus tanneri]KAA8641899.1 hypothetical protein ATNIH1004_010838 [Aspergillus tanneri]THC98364.1 hypothetical protein EYZ11_002145 [Aspergillus tanneri]
MAQTPSDTCCLSPSDWTSLNKTLSGRLIRTIPPGSVCYPTHNNYNPEVCKRVLYNWTSPTFHSADLASVYGPPIANSSCNPIYPNGTSISGYPKAGRKADRLEKYPPCVANTAEEARSLRPMIAKTKASFWAIRGGGAFGVILNITVNEYPVQSLSIIGINMEG